MAKIKFGMMMTDARGKLGGQVFSKNRAGAYVRTKTTPVNPRTEAQMFNRSILASLSIGWDGLTQAQIKAWNEAVEDYKKTDVFGDLKTPTGKNLYTSLNKNLLQSGQSAISLPQDKVEVPVVTATTAVVDEATTSITFPGLTAVPAGMKLQVRATPVLPNGVSYIKNKLRVIDNIATGAITGTSVWGKYVDRFGALPAGSKVAFELKYIASTGQAGVPVNFTVITA